MSHPAGDLHPRRRRTAWAGLAVALAALCYVGVAWWAARDVPSDAHAAGLALGGLSSQEAHRALAEEAQSWGTEPLEVRLGGQTAHIVPADAGIGVDVAATIGPLTRLSLDPRVVVSRLAGGGEVPVVTRVDVARFEDVLRPAVAQAERPVREAAFSFTGGRLEGTRPEAGVRVDVHQPQAGPGVRHGRES